MTTIEAEQKAVQSLVDLYTQAQRCRELHETAQMSLPDALKRFLGMSEGRAKIKHRPVGVQRPETPRRPKGVDPSWVVIKVEDALPTSVALALLAGADGPIRSRDIIRRVAERLPDVSEGSIANIGTRLSTEKIIRRREDGWTLRDPDYAGIIDDEFLWAPADKLTRPELAAHRRDSIVHILRHFATGLEPVQIVGELNKCDWVRAPVSKDLLKADIPVLASAGKIRRRGNTHKYEVSPAKLDKEDDLRRSRMTNGAAEAAP